MKILIINSPKFGKHTVLYDDEDHELISKYKWHIVHIGYSRNNIYATTTIYNPKPGESSKLYMHILVRGKKNIDHKDRNGLNNQKKNLRDALNKNTCNIAPRSNNTSGYKGVSETKNGYYKVSITSVGIKMYGGTFRNKKDAAKKYNKMAKEHHGEFAYLNPILK